MLYIVPGYLEAAKWAGIARELKAAFEYNEFFNPDVLDDCYKYRAVIDAYKSLGRDCSADTLHGAFFDITINSSDPKIRAISDMRVHQSMDAARELGCKAVIFHTNYIVGFRSFKYRSEWVRDNAEYFRNLLAEYPGLEIYVENMFDDTPEMLRNLSELMEDEPRFGVCFDLSHAYLWDLPLSVWIDELGPYIRHLHLNDNNKDEDAHLAIGDGTLPWEILRDRALFANKPSVLIEVKTEEKLRKSYDFLIQNHYLSTEL